MDRLPTRMPFGTPVTGSTGEGNGSGFRATGKGLQDPMQFGSPGAGKRDAGGGSGLKDTGSIDNRVVAFIELLGLSGFKYQPHELDKLNKLDNPKRVKPCSVLGFRKFLS